MAQNNQESVILQMDKSTRQMMDKVQSDISSGVQTAIQDVEKRIKDLHELVEEDIYDKVRAIDNRVAETLSSLGSVKTGISAGVESAKNELKADLDYLKSGQASYFEELEKTVGYCQDAIGKCAAEIREVMAYQDSRLREMAKWMETFATSVDEKLSILDQENKSLSSELTSIKALLESNQRTLNRIEYNSTPFWRFKQRKEAKERLL